MEKSCTKKKFKDKLAAMFALSQAKRLGNFISKRNEKRFYYCPICKAWHLTSQAER